MWTLRLLLISLNIKLRKKDGRQKNKNIDGGVKSHNFHYYGLASRLLGS
jgi:hypothetical protein